jgi:excisionase family DNA binding protein
VGADNYLLLVDQPQAAAASDETREPRPANARLLLCAISNSGLRPPERWPIRAERVVEIALSLAEPLLTAAEVADLLAVPRSSVYEYTRRLHDPLPCVQIGRHRRFHRSAIEAWLARQASPTS